MSDVFRILAEIQLQVAGKPELDKLDAQIKNVTTDQQRLNATAAALTKEIAATNSLAQKQVLTTALKNTEAQLAKTTAEAKKLAGVIDQPQKKGGLFDLSSILNVAAGNVAANVIGTISGLYLTLRAALFQLQPSLRGTTHNLQRCWVVPKRQPERWQISLSLHLRHHLKFRNLRQPLHV
jgi:hypothetical protein